MCEVWLLACSSCRILTPSLHNNIHRIITTLRLIFSSFAHVPPTRRKQHQRPPCSIVLAARRCSVSVVTISCCAAASRGLATHEIERQVAPVQLRRASGREA